MAFIERFPDLSSAIWVEGDNLSFLDISNDITVYAYVIHCDIWIPKDIKFVPVMYKEYDSNGNKKKSIFATGNLRSVWFCDLDIKEIIRYGGKVTKVYSGMLFTRSIENPFKEIIQT